MRLNHPAKMSWSRLLSSQRLGRRGAHLTTTHDSTGRSDFLSDIDRLTFSPSFRRMARKTQVFPLAANDHVHNRLTHSLEVSRVGRTLGAAVGQQILADRKYRNDDRIYRTEYDVGSIVEAASLAHDIGHPPFGHAGDKAVKRWFDMSSVARDVTRAVSRSEFDDLRNFDGNAQGFRRITQLEKQVFSGGLNLTYATLGSYIKYPMFASGKSEKSGFFRSERTIVQEVAEGVGLARRGGGFCRHPLSFLVEAADDTCYGILDIEDAVEMGILSLGGALDTLLQAFPAKERAQYRPKADETSHRVVFSRVRGRIFRQAISCAVRAFFRHYDAIMAGDFEEELLAAAAKRGEIGAKAVLEAKERAKAEVFTYGHKVSVELASYAVIARLLDEFVAAALAFAAACAKHAKPRLRDSKSEALLGMLGDHRPRKDNAPGGGRWTAYQCTRRAIDYVTGMTDDFAIDVSRQLSGDVVLRT